MKNPFLVLFALLSAALVVITVALLALNKQGPRNAHTMEPMAGHMLTVHAPFNGKWDTFHPQRVLFLDNGCILFMQGNAVYTTSTFNIQDAPAQ